MAESRETQSNALGQPIGFQVSDWAGAHPPSREVIAGDRCRLEPIDAERHASALFSAYQADTEGRNWTYLPYGPFASAAEYAEQVQAFEAIEDTYFFAIVDQSTESAVGVASYLRAAPAMGSIEVGHLSYAPCLQRTPVSTEAMYLMMRRVFDEWGYRRYEWKCHALNAPSRAAAARLGFRFEGIFRQHVVAKDRNRDTAWFSITDDEWPALRAGYEAWLAPANFAGQGEQRARLESFLPASAGQPLVAEVGSSIYER